MSEYRLVPEALRERAMQGTLPRNKISRDLLAGKTVFVKSGQVRSLYSLAKNHDMICHTQKTSINEEKGTLVYFTPENSKDQSIIID